MLELNQMTSGYHFFRRMHSLTLKLLSGSTPDISTKDYDNHNFKKHFFIQMISTLLPKRLIAFIQNIFNITPSSQAISDRNSFGHYLDRNSAAVPPLPKPQTSSRITAHTLSLPPLPNEKIDCDLKSHSYNIHGYDLEPEIPAEEFHNLSGGEKISGTFIPVSRTTKPLTEPDWDPTFILLDNQNYDLIDLGRKHIVESAPYPHSLDVTKSNHPLTKYAQAIRIMAERRNWLSPKSTSALNKLMDGNLSLTKSELNSIN
jgi:hypothetical protein